MHEERVIDTETGRRGWLTRSVFTNTLCVQFDGDDLITLVDEGMNLVPEPAESATEAR